MKAPPRGFDELETNDEIAYVSSAPQDIELNIDDYVETVDYVRKDCEGLLLIVRRLLVCNALHVFDFSRLLTACIGDGHALKC